MRIARKLNDDQEMLNRFIAVLGSGMIELSSNKFARPGFFILAHSFITEYIEGVLSRRKNCSSRPWKILGFPPDGGPTGFLRSEQKKSREAAEHMINAAKAWQAGDENARIDVGWAASEFTSNFREHLERLKSRSSH